MHDIDSGHSGRDRQSHDSGVLLGQHHTASQHTQQLVSHAQPSGRHADTVLAVPQAQSGCDSDRSDLGRSGHMGHTQEPGIATFTDRCAFFLIPGYFIIAIPLLPPCS